jgi:hypothetical protein
MVNIKRSERLLLSSNEREAAYIESAFRAVEWVDTAFKTDDDDLALVGDDGADAGKKQSDNWNGIANTT